MILDGRHLSTAEQKALHAEMDEVFQLWGAESKIVTNPWMPWTTDGAAALDAQSLAAKIPASVSELAKKAILLEFELDNCIPAGEQSWLGALSQLAAGGGYAFFEETEVFRCAAGNQVPRRAASPPVSISIRDAPRTSTPATGSSSTSTAARKTVRSITSSWPCRAWRWRRSPSMASRSRIAPSRTGRR